MTFTESDTTLHWFYNNDELVAFTNPPGDKSIPSEIIFYIHKKTDGQLKKKYNRPLKELYEKILFDITGREHTLSSCESKNDHPIVQWKEGEIEKLNKFKELITNHEILKRVDDYYESQKESPESLGKVRCWYIVLVFLYLTIKNKKGMRTDFKIDEKRIIVPHFLCDNYEGMVVAISYYFVFDDKRRTEETKSSTMERERLTFDIHEEEKAAPNEEVDEETKETPEEEQKGSEIPPIQSEAKEIDESLEFYYDCEPSADSKTMLCRTDFNWKCRYCFVETNNHVEEECKEEKRRKNIEERWEVIRKRRNLTGRVEDYLRVCDDCKLNVFKGPNRSTISCPYCNKELKDFN